MKTHHKVILGMAAFLILCIIVGVVMLIISARDTSETVYEILAFVISGAGVFIAISSQITAYKERRESAKIIDELNRVIATDKAGKSRDATIEHKLDQIIADKRK